MKLLLLLALAVGLPVMGHSETFRTTRVYRTEPVGRVTTVRTVTTPSLEVYRGWDTRRDYLWNQRRYHWDGGTWIVAPGTFYRGGGYGSSSTLMDDVGETNSPDEPEVRTITRVETAAPTTVDLQRGLARRGYYHGAIDGIVGPGTRSAIAAYQADHGQEPNGLMTPAVVDSLAR